MIIGIDGNEANVNNRVGVNKYAFEIISGVQKSLPKNPDLVIIVYLKVKPLADMPSETKNFKYKILTGRKVWILTKLTPYLLKNSDKLDVFFAPSHYLPPISVIPMVCSIMDLGYAEFSAQFKKYDFWQLKYWTAISISRSKYLLTISNATAKDIVRLYPNSRNKVVVTYPGVDEDIKIKNIDEIKRKYFIVGDYILYLGTLKPSKNIEGLISAYAAVKKQNKEIQLVIAGKKGWLYESIFSKVKELGLTKNVVFTDFVDEKDKCGLIKGAKVFVLPSFWEGFGLDILTAFALSVPVVSSNAGSLPEVVGDAGILVDPNNTNSIAKAIVKTLNMTKKEYGKIVEMQKKQLKKFSWKRTTELTVETLRKAANA